MTDNEIIKGVDCCTKTYCLSCPYDDNGCLMALHKDTLALINRQNDLIYRQSDVISEQKEKVERMYVDAVKEFAERLKTKERPTFPLAMVIDVYEIDNLVKEMVGEG